jgi:hypothetical protein
LIAPINYPLFKSLKNISFYEICNFKPQGRIHPYERGGTFLNELKPAIVRASIHTAPAPGWHIASKAGKTCIPADATMTRVSDNT